MADDEGAAYWEGVYGQPIHTYAAARAAGGGAGEGEPAAMTDDEFAAYVRRQMWERTHAGLLEARARRERAEKARRDGDEAAAGRVRAEAEAEAALRRGEERRRRRVWGARWEAYRAACGRWDAGPSVETIPWVLREAKTDEDVKMMFLRGLDVETRGEGVLAATLKEERVRWHPDKVQQKLGGTVSEAVMKEVTATFQLIDGLWNETKKR